MEKREAGIGTRSRAASMHNARVESDCWLGNETILKLGNAIYRVAIEKPSSPGCGSCRCVFAMLQNHTDYIQSKVNQSKCLMRCVGRVVRVRAPRRIRVSRHACRLFQKRSLPPAVALVHAAAVLTSAATAPAGAAPTAPGTAAPMAAPIRSAGTSSAVATASAATFGGAEGLREEGRKAVSCLES